MYLNLNFFFRKFIEHARFLFTYSIGEYSYQKRKYRPFIFGGDDKKLVVQGNFAKGPSPK